MSRQNKTVDETAPDKGMVLCSNNKGKEIYFPKHVIAKEGFKRTGFSPVDEVSIPYIKKMKQPLSSDSDKEDFAKSINSHVDIKTLEGLKKKFKADWQLEIIENRINEVKTKTV